MFSCEYCKIFKNTYFEEYLRTATSGMILEAMIVNPVSLFDFSVKDYFLD